MEITNTVVEHYADVYYRAWREASDDCLAAVEYKAIQDIMYWALHVKNNTLAMSMSSILAYFVSRRKQKGIESMLQRLYEPLLWRALSVTNSHVRLRATTLFFNAFPLQDPDNKNADDVDKALQKQYDQMHELLMDTVPGACVACDV